MAGTSAEPLAPIRSRKREDLSAGERRLRKGSVVAIRLWWASIAICWPVGCRGHRLAWLVCRRGGRLLRWVERRFAHASCGALPGPALAIFAVRPACFLAPCGQSARGLLAHHCCTRSRRVGAPGATGSWRRLERERAGFCPRRSRIWRHRRVPAATTYSPGDFQRASNAGGHSRAPVHTRRDDAFISWAWGP